MNLALHAYKELELYTLYYVQQVGSVYKAGLIATIVASLLCFEMDRLALIVLFVYVDDRSF